MSLLKSVPRPRARAHSQHPITHRFFPVKSPHSNDVICEYLGAKLNVLTQVVSDPSLAKSGVYWSWNQNSASFENQLSKEASDVEKAKKVWELSEKLVGLV